MQWHVAPCLWVLQPESCGGDDLCDDAVLLGLAAGAMGRLGVECNVGDGVGGDPVADGIAGGWRRGGGVVVEEGNVGRCGSETSPPPEGAGVCRADCPYCGLVDGAEDVP